LLELFWEFVVKLDEFVEFCKELELSELTLTELELAEFWEKIKKPVVKTKTKEMRIGTIILGFWKILNIIK